MPKEKKPNIVFAFADDWGRYASIYSKYENVAPLTSSVNEFIHTPNFDRVAKEGVLFLNALVPAPSCTPCRSSVLSGRYFWQTGLGTVFENHRKSRIQHCERSELRLHFKWTKCQKMVQFDEFLTN